MTIWVMHYRLQILENSNKNCVFLADEKYKEIVNEVLSLENKKPTRKPKNSPSDNWLLERCV